MGAILLIEDDEDVQNLIARFFSQRDAKVLLSDIAGVEKGDGASYVPNEKKEAGGRIEEAVRETLKADADLKKRGSIHEIIIGRVEKALIGTVLEEENGNQVRAARRLGINRNTLRKKMKELKIVPRIMFVDSAAENGSETKLMAS
jgi:two-component system, NtrC family, nitrogen regulation response regulator GlnG